MPISASNPNITNPMSFIRFQSTPQSNKCRGQFSAPHLSPLISDTVQFSSAPNSKREKRQETIATFLKSLGIDVEHIIDNSDQSREEALELFDRAFTHMSVKKNDNYEYLEFLGDGILSGIVREYFFHRLPRGNEQKYLKSHHKLYEICGSNAFLSVIAKDLNITRPDILLINHDEMKQHAQQSTSKKDDLAQGKPKLSPEEWEQKWRSKYIERLKKVPADSMEGLIGALNIVDSSQQSIKDLIYPYLDIVMTLVTPEQLEQGSIDYNSTMSNFVKHAKLKNIK